MKRDFKIIFAVFILFGFLLSSCERDVEQPIVLAKVGKSTLTLDQVLNSMGSTLNTQTSASDIEEYLRNWVDEELIYQEAIKAGVASLPEIQEELRKVRRALIVNVYLDSLIPDSTTFLEDTLHSYYENNSELFARDQNEYRYFYLLCKNRTVAQRVLRELRKGAAFDSLVQKYFPDDVLNRYWDSGYVTEEQTIPEIRRFLKTLKPGTLYGPVAVSGEWIVFRTVERYPAGSVRSFELVKEQIRTRLQEEWYQEKYKELLSNLHSGKPVHIYLDRIEQGLLERKQLAKGEVSDAEN